ncbi:17315_t:CDS:2, partial [Cetraspora pellucida]
KNLAPLYLLLGLILDILLANHHVAEIDAHLDDMKKNRPDYYAACDKDCDICGVKLCCHFEGRACSEDPEQQNYHKIIEKLPTQSLSLSELQNNNTNSNSNKDNKSLYKGLAIGAVVVVLITGLIAYYLQFFAQKKGGGSAATNCSHKSYNPNNLGVKIFGSQLVKKGNIIVRQHGTKYKGGSGVFLELPPNITADFALTLALPISHKTKQKPPEIAQQIIKITNCPDLEHTITSQGYINFRFPIAYYQQFLNETLTHTGQNLRGEKKNLCLNIEYVSANPTGYLHLAHFRHAVVGSTLANIYQFCGYPMTREYYINDRGGQITSLINSVYYFYHQLQNATPIKAGQIDLYEKKQHLELLTELEKKNLIYIQDGATSFRSSLGADHHGTIARLKSAYQLLGHNPENLQIILVQTVNLLTKDGPTRFSKRAGNTIELAETLKYLQLDQLKFFLCEKDPNQPLSINTELLKENQEKTRLYYIQYAHARCHQIFQKAQQKNIDRIGSSIDLLTDQAERSIFNLLIRFSFVLENVIEENKPHHLINYLYELARA